MATYNLASNGYGNALLPVGTKPLPDPILIYHQQGLVAIIRAYYHLFLNASTSKLLIKYIYAYHGVGFGMK